MEISDIDVDTFLANLSDPVVAGTMAELDHIITRAMPDRRRVVYSGAFWGGTDQEIIGCGHIIQPRPRGEEVHWFLVGLARRKNYYSLYVNAVENGAYLGKQYADRLGKVKIGSASIGFTSIDDLDLDVLTELLRRADEVTPADPASD
jgi:hypothetical protein